MNDISLPTSANCDHQRIETFLHSDHYRIEDDELITHLDSCSACREYLETHAADRETWNRALTLLKSDEFDNAATAAFSAAGSQTQSGHFPHAIQDVLDALAPTDDPHRLGRIGTYEIAGVIGAGAMGVVLKAIDPSLDRVIALKVMAPRLANNETARKRFAREAKAAAAVLHPNVIPIHSVSSDKALPYLVMAYIRGGSLQKRLEKEGPLQLDEILRIGSQIAAGLAAAHEQGLVHRDIKPENILLEEGIERVTITDFGLARAVDDNTVTQMGVIAGTPMYMSPEQARGEQVDQLSDLFSLGSVLYALCTGQPPYRADSSYGVMRRIIDESPTPIRKLNPAIPEWLACIVERLMAKEKSARFATASEVHKLLDACLSHVQQPNVLPLPSIPNLKPVPEQPSFLKSRKGLLTMLAATAASVAMVYAAFFAAPEEPSLTITAPSSSSVNKTETKQEPAFLKVKSHNSQGKDTDELTHRWELDGKSVGRVVIRVLHIEDGKTHVKSESVFQSGTAGDGKIEVELHLKDTNQPRPTAGKTLIPNLTVSAAGLQAKSQTTEKIDVHGDLGTVSFTSEGKLEPSHILLHSALMHGKVEYTPTLKSMTEASKNGASFLVTTVDWQTTDQVTAPQSDDLKNIQGTWQVNFVEDDGRVSTEEALKDVKVVFTKDTLTFHIAGKKSESTYKLDPSTSPKSIDMTEFGKTKIGIYDLQGDTLRICFAKKSKERPTKFDSQPNSPNNIITVMKRVAEQEKPMPPPEKPVSKLSDIKDGDYFIQVTQQAKDFKADFPDDVIPDKKYVPAEDKANLTLRVQFLDKGKQVRIIDKELLNNSKVPVWSRTESDDQWTYENASGESSNGMGKLMLKQKDNELVATFDVHGSGFPILSSLRGSLVEVTDANRAKLEANAMKTLQLEDGDYVFKVSRIAANPGVQTIQSPIPFDDYKPVKKPTSFRVQISNNTFSVTLIDDQAPAKVGGKGLASKEQPWDHLTVYEISGEGFEPGELILQKSGIELDAIYKISGPGTPVLASYSGTLVKVNKEAAKDDKPKKKED